MGGFLAGLTMTSTVLALFTFWLFSLLDDCSWTKGRPLRGRGRRPRPAPPTGSDRTRAGQHWRSMAQEEYESVASFGELALDLMAAGAPARLIERCHQAAREELRHTEQCLEIAGLYGADTELPGDIPALRKARSRPRWRSALLTRLAVESYVDGCLGEASSAIVLGKLAAETTDENTRRILKILAKEEMGHARLSQDIVEWSLSRGGPVVQRAVTRAKKRANKLATRDLSGDGHSLRAYGVPDGDLRQAALARAVEIYG